MLAISEVISSQTSAGLRFCFCVNYSKWADVNMIGWDLYIQAARAPRERRRAASANSVVKFHLLPSRRIAFLHSFRLENIVKESERVVEAWMMVCSHAKVSVHLHEVMRCLD